MTDPASRRVRTVAPAKPGNLPWWSGRHGAQKLPTVVQLNYINMPTVVKPEIIAEYKIHEKDTGSSEVQIALLTARINHLTEHLRTHRKDFHSRRGLLQMASRRRKLLDYLKHHNLPKYNELLQKLNLRK